MYYLRELSEVMVVCIGIFSVLVCGAWGVRISVHCTIEHNAILRVYLSSTYTSVPTMC